MFFWPFWPNSRYMALLKTSHNLQVLICVEGLTSSLNQFALSHWLSKFTTLHARQRFQLSKNSSASHRCHSLSHGIGLQSQPLLHQPLSSTEYLKLFCSTKNRCFRTASYMPHICLWNLCSAWNVSGTTITTASCHTCFVGCHYNGKQNLKSCMKTTGILWSWTWILDKVRHTLV